MANIPLATTPVARKKSSLVVSGKEVTVQGVIITVGVIATNVPTNYEVGRMVYTTQPNGLWAAIDPAMTTANLTGPTFAVGLIAETLAGVDGIPANVPVGAYRINVYTSGNFNKQMVLAANPGITQGGLDGFEMSLRSKGIHLIAVAGESVRTLA